MKLIPGWPELRLKCFKCGEKRSVKYQLNDGSTICSMCFLKAWGF